MSGTAAAQAASSQHAISVRSLRLGFGERVLLEKASFDVHRAEIVVIVGGSGSGKSSLMKTICGLHAPLAGDVLIEGESLVHAQAETRARLQRRLGVMYQGGALFGSLTVLENVRFPLDRLTHLALEQKNLIVRLLLRELELDNAESRLPVELSGGMVKRAAIARAMALGCGILLLDEPSAGLDPVTAANLDSTILSLRCNLGTTVVLVSHELPSIFAIADRAIMLDPISRAIIADDKPDVLKSSRDPRVQQFFNRRPDRSRTTRDGEP